MSCVMDSNIPECQSQEKISSQYLWQKAPLVAEPSHRPKDSLLPVSLELIVS